MNTEKDIPLLFASESSIFRIASISKIISWIILVFYLIRFAGDIGSIMQGQVSWPAQPSQWPFIIANLFFAPVIGLFYFLVLQAAAQGLNLGLDLYYGSQPADEQEEPQ